MINGFHTEIGKMQASDKRVGLSLISLFGLVGYFVEVVLERTNIKEIIK